MPSDFDLCRHICQVASGLGYKIDDLGNSISGQSFTFVAPDGTRIAGGICADRQRALILACKRLMPLISEHL